MAAESVKRIGGSGLVVGGQGEPGVQGVGTGQFLWLDVSGKPPVRMCWTMGFLPVFEFEHVETTRLRSFKENCKNTGGSAHQDGAVSMVSGAGTGWVEWVGGRGRGDLGGPVSKDRLLW